MTWPLFWKLLGLFVLVVGAKNSANISWYRGAMGSFTFWIVVMVLAVAGMIVVAG